MPKRENLWLAVSHKLPPESKWGRIGHPVEVKGGYAFVVAGNLPPSPLAPGGRVYTVIRYDIASDTIEPVPRYTFRNRQTATDALFYYQAREGVK